jgi:cytochrome d ubiquinol oxidase subunit I
VGWLLPPAGLLGTFGVLAANSWMNTPAGFQLGPDGRPANVNVLGALFTPALGYEFWHFVIAMYMTAAFMVASVYAVGWLRGRRDRYHRLGFTLPFTMGAVLTPVQLVVGDVVTRAALNDQPAKFAAMEITWATQSHNPEIIGGVLTGDGHVHLGVAIPTLDSLLAGFSPDTVVRGLSSFPAADRPSVLDADFVHLAFDAMVGLGSVACLLVLWYALAWLRHRDLPRSRVFFWGAALAGVGSYVAMECGWITTEVGRQPWIVYNLMKVEAAATGNTGVWLTFLGVLALYAGVGVTLILVLRLMSRRYRGEEGGGDDDVPYGPRSTPDLDASTVG